MGTVQDATTRHERTLPSTPASIARGRRDAHELLRDHLTPVEAGDLELLISEVLTNAVRHGGGPEVGLALELQGEVLLVEVTDAGAGFVPVPRATAPEAEGGYGLFLVEQLTRRWGMTRERGRTCVWFELAIGQAPA